MKKINSILNISIPILFIGFPAIIGFYFYSPDWGNNIMKPLWFYWICGLGFLLYVFIILFIFIYFKVLDLNIINYNVPIAISFVTIFVSFEWHVWLRILACIIVVLTAFPINYFVMKIKNKK